MEAIPAKLKPPAPTWGMEFDRQYPLEGIYPLKKQTKKQLRDLLSKDSSMLELLKPLNEFYQELLFAKIFSGTNQAKKSFSLLAPSILRQLPMYANNYSGKEIVSALKRLGKIDKQIKSSQIDDESAITECIFSATSDG